MKNPLLIVLSMTGLLLGFADRSCAQQLDLSQIRAAQLSLGGTFMWRFVERKYPPGSKDSIKEWKEAGSLNLSVGLLPGDSNVITKLVKDSLFIQGRGPARWDGNRPYYSIVAVVDPDLQILTKFILKWDFWGDKRTSNPTESKSIELDTVPYTLLDHRLLVSQKGQGIARYLTTIIVSDHIYSQFEPVWKGIIDVVDGSDAFFSLELSSAPAAMVESAGALQLDLLPLGTEYAIYDLLGRKVLHGLTDQSIDFATLGKKLGLEAGGYILRALLNEWTTYKLMISK
jgi:hypothetical protein